MSLALLHAAFAASLLLSPRHPVAPAPCLAIGRFEKLATGFCFTEGPAIDEHGNLYFTDQRDLPGRIYRLDPRGKLHLLVADAGRANGLAFNSHGELVACQMDGRIVAYSPDGASYRVLASGYRGRRFNAPNDLAIDRHDGIYFTDPFLNAPRPLPQRRSAVYYLAPDGTVSRLFNDLWAPNGIGLSPDQQTLYVTSSGHPQVMAYRILGPGKLGPGRVHARVAGDWRAPLYKGGDGMAIDDQGNLFLATHRGVQVFDPCGNLLCILCVPEEPSNVAFSRDGKTLYVTAERSVYAATLECGGSTPLWIGRPREPR